MASCSSLLSEEQLMCSICLDVFIDPVTTHCGHNFCKACITKYWDSNDLCQCPLCKKTFDKKPNLSVNTFISELTAQFRKSVPVKSASGSDQHLAKPEVSCDFCTGTKFKALKSCLVCAASYCEAHLEPHLRVARLTKHKLIDPVENLEDRLCIKHEKPLELFCRTDQTCVCQFCTETDHKTHDIVPLEEECEERKTQVKKTGGEVQQMIQERLEKVREIKLSMKARKMDAEKEISDSVDAFTALVRSIERSQAELSEVIEENQKSAEKQAEGFIKELEEEITELERKGSELEKLLHIENNLELLQSVSPLSTPPPTKDWPEITVRSVWGVEEVRRAVSQLEDTLNEEMEKIPEVKLKRIQQCAVDVTLDPDTAHPLLILSEDGKTIHVGDIQKNLPDTQKRFDYCGCVVGNQSFSSGRFYYEVQVGGTTSWDLGVVSESINRKGAVTLDPGNGYWTMILRNGHDYKISAIPSVPVSLSKKLQMLGVFVDYEEGQVSFYDVEAKSHIYSYTGCNFTEKLYPFLGSGEDRSGFLIITPVNDNQSVEKIN